MEPTPPLFVIKDETVIIPPQHAINPLRPDYVRTEPQRGRNESIISCAAGQPVPCDFPYRDEESSRRLRRSI